MTSFVASLAAEQPGIHAALSEATEQLPASVRPVARHVLGPGGKRLRPSLTVLTARLLGYRNADIYGLAAAMEMFHVATLLHDDVLDNASLRRGQEAAHRIFGVAQTILAGDALLAKGNHMVATYGDPRLTAAVAEAIARTADGEILEIEQQGKLTTDLTTYLDVITGKTAWMIRTACAVGAIRAGGSEAQIAAATAYGHNLGMAFQIVDDALDFAPTAATGKPEGGDVREGKLTPPIYFYFQSLDPSGQERFSASFSRLAFTEEEVRDITSAIRTQGLDEKTRNMADQYLHKAQDALDSLAAEKAEPAYVKTLTGLISHVRDRNA